MKQNDHSSASQFKIFLDDSDWLTKSRIIQTWLGLIIFIPCYSSPLSDLFCPRFEVIDTGL